LDLRQKHAGMTDFVSLPFLLNRSFCGRVINND
ncbi:MAG: hypothetical protein ACI9MF_000885, partial [Gammaproteobacteria bacterium]